MEGEGNTLTLGKSILVPSVQELAKGCLNEIPQRYIRCEAESGDYLNDDVDNVQVPIINFESLINGDGVELQKLHTTCQDWGFFQLINHGVNFSLVEKFKLETQEFFNLPMQEKKRYWQTPTDSEGFGQAFVTSEEQKLDWADRFYLTTLPKHLRKPHLLPMLPLPYRDTLESYSAELQKLGGKILKFVAKALNIDSELGRRTVFGEGYQSIRINYYPPCPQPEKAVGISPHTDTTVLIAILLQINEMEGLQINKNGKWVTIKPLPHAFVVNIGDVLEIMSNGIYQSVLHRAVVNATKERLSVATFVAPSLEVEIGPFPSLITSTTPAKFRRITMTNFWKSFLQRPLDGKRFVNETLRITEDDGNYSKRNSP